MCVCGARIVKDEYIIFIHEVVNIFKCTHSARAYFTGENGCKFLFCFVVFFCSCCCCCCCFAIWFDFVLVVLDVTMQYIMLFLLFLLEKLFRLSLYRSRQLPLYFGCGTPKYTVASLLLLLQCLIMLLFCRSFAFLFFTFQLLCRVSCRFLLMHLVFILFITNCSFLLSLLRRWW